MKIADIRTCERHLLIFFFTLTPLTSKRGSKGVDKKKKSKHAPSFNEGHYVISLIRLDAKLEDAALKSHVRHT